METTAIQNEKTIIKQIEIINARLKNSKLRPAVLAKIDSNLEFVAKATNCSKRQSMLFALIFGLNFNYSEVSLNNIADFLDCDCLKIAGMIDDFDTLVKMNMIRQDESRNPKTRISRKTEYYISGKLFNEVLRGLVSDKIKKEDNTFIEFLALVQDLYEGRDIEEMNLSELNDERDFLVNSNSHLTFAREIKKHELSDEEKHILLIISYNLFDDCDSVDLDMILDKIFKKNMVEKFHLRKSIIKGELNLMKKELIDLEEGLFRSDRYLKLTDKGIETFFMDETLYLEKSKKKKSKDMILAKDIAHKELFYNNLEIEQFDFLENTLKDDNLKKLQQRLQEQHLPTGIAILFHGAPGTGKTEMVYQLARKTGRDIQLVDISATKTMWFGESEKLIKKIFVKYKAKVEKDEKCPILFFNEADAVFSKRREIGSGSVDQTENAIQNIILQEMETLNGILFATTNLTLNLDSAFDRRFLYKINFEKPEVEIQQKIWMSKITSLKHKQAAVLAGKYSFTGGQIDNICRKFITHQVLTGEAPTLEIIEKFCAQENITNDFRKIGF